MFNPNNTILSGQSPATLQLWLTQAQSAYAQLATGARVVSATYDGKSVTYKAGDQATLVQWISLLQRQLGVNRGRRALRPYF
jgi:hypothetical protein